MYFARGPTRSITRSRISAAALLVNVIARIEPGCALRSEISHAMRRVSTRVLPEPAPATTSSGAPSCTTAARCGSFSPAGRASAGGAAPRSGFSEPESGRPRPMTGRVSLISRPAYGPPPPGDPSVEPVETTGRGPRHRRRVSTRGRELAGSLVRLLNLTSPTPRVRTSRSAARSEQAAVGRPSGELVARRQLELPQHAGHVGLDGLDRDEQLARDLLVGVPTGDQPHHLAFALGETVEVLVDGGDLDRAGERVEHEPRQTGREHRVPFGDATDRVDELRAGDRLGDVAARAGADRADHVLRGVGDRQGEEAWPVGRHR